MNTQLVLNNEERTLTIFTQNLVIKSYDGYQFSVPEDLVEDIKLSDLPDDIMICPYKRFGKDGLGREDYDPLIKISKETDCQALVYFMGPVQIDEWHQELSSHLILKQPSQKYDIYRFEEFCWEGSTATKYQILIKGTTIKEIIEAALDFNSRLEDTFYELISKIETGCRVEPRKVEEKNLIEDTGSRNRPFQENKIWNQSKFPFA